ncbi:hypothetical protein QYE76_000315 [Lolium multiflorum]|uniref:DUF8039 domain-containing protein n=1 Tax=Lolium multiflorum TaxID=4521 RepID=A0AAD8RIK7_LOLMU|nr:hypothetical protein QYE76_000315 [Lolium multiflorum]
MGKKYWPFRKTKNDHKPSGSRSGKKPRVGRYVRIEFARRLSEENRPIRWRRIKIAVEEEDNDDEDEDEDEDEEAEVERADNEHGLAEDLSQYARMEHRPKKTYVKMKQAALAAGSFLGDARASGTTHRRQTSSPFIQKEGMMKMKRQEEVKMKRHQMSPLMMIFVGPSLMHTEKQKLKKLKGMLDDHKKKLYPNCEDGNTKLGATLELLQWKAEADRKKDEMLRHPADGSQWRTIDREFPDFADDARNLRPEGSISKGYGTEEVIEFRKLLVNFILPEPADSDSENDRPDPEDPELNSVQRRVKKWALKKMAVQFNDYKKKLDNFFVKKNKTPDFNGPYEKIKDHWEAFVKYKTSERAKKRSATNTQNAANKMYFHTMGRGGYKAGRPKWEKWENDLIEKGIQPEGSQRKSSVASTELPGNDADVDPHKAPPSPVDPHMAPPSPVDPQMAPRYPVDYITETTPCELHFKTMGYLTLKAAIGYVLPPVPDQRYHFKPVPHGYAVAGVDQVMDGYGPLRLDHPAGGGDLLELGEAKNTIVLWRKEFIVIPGWEKPRTLQSPPSQHSPPMQPSPVRQPSPPAREPSPPPREPSPPPREPSPPPQATTQSKSKKRTATAMSRNRSPKRKQEPLPRVPKVPPKRPYDYTVEENAKIAKEQHMKSMFGKKKPQPEPEPAISKEKKLKLLKNLHQPEPRLSSNYDRSIRKSNVVAKERWQKNCLDPTLVALYKDEADANNMSIPEYLCRLEFIQTDDVQIAYQYKYGQSLLFNQDALNKSLLSAYCLIKIRECRKGQIYDLGFIDPYTVNGYTVDNSPKDTENNLVYALRKNLYKRAILFPYNFA